MIVVDIANADHGLPTFDEILGCAVLALDEAYRAASDAQDWLRSDWRPVGSSLTDRQVEARMGLQASLVAVKQEINRAKAGLAFGRW